MTDTDRGMTVVIGTRGSQLARWQTNRVQELLQAAHADLQVEVTVITTQGDRVLDTPLPLLGGKGLFTAELEAELHSGAIDYAVHSLKDLPTDDPDGLIVGAIPERAIPFDVLVSRKGHTLDTLPEKATVGTSSRRRAAQLLHQRPDLHIIDVRGNIDTRVKKALDDEGPYDAIVLAQAGLSRLGMDDVISEVLSPQQMLPAPGQGALGIQCRNEPESLQTLAPIHHLETAMAVTAERAFLAALGGGCSVPVAAYALKQPNGMYDLIGRVCAVDGSMLIEVETKFTGDRIENALHAGKELAEQAIDRGAGPLLEAAE
ncbi:hydroxymethylbilane synthase [Phototrophicus methaneseepsis]|nr:hydroxymethylbilane synthase [Phototrophicus methaneseepsis]